MAAEVQKTTQAAAASFGKFAQAGAGAESQTRDIGTGAQRMAADVQRATSTAAAGLQRLAAAPAAATAAMRGVGTAATHMGAEVSTSSSTATRAFGSMETAIRAVAASLVLRKIIDYADTAKLLEGRIKLVTSSSQELTQVQDALFASAQRTRTGYEATVDLYGRIARNSKELGASQTDLLQVTETVNKAIRISGVSASSAEAALVQLGQGFASGTLRGEELNSVLEQTPRLAEAIAKGMGVTIGELRKLGQEGELTAKAVFDALKTQIKAVDEEFGRLPQTVGEALTKLDNAVQQFIGTVDKATESTSLLAKGISFLANSISFAAGKIPELEISGLMQKLREGSVELVRLQKQMDDFGGEGAFSATATTAEIAKLSKELETTRTRVMELQQAQEPATASQEKAAATTVALTKEQEALIKSYEKQIARIKEHGETLNLSGKALADYQAKQVLAETGNKALSEAMRAAVMIDEQAKASKEAVTKAEQAQTKALREAETVKKKIAKDEADRVQEVKNSRLLTNKLIQETFELRQKEAEAAQKEEEANRVTLAQLNEEIRQLKEEGQVIAAGLGPKAALLELEKKIALARTDRATAAELAVKGEKELTEEQKKAVISAGEYAKANIELAASHKKQAQALEDAILTTRDMEHLRSDIIRNLFDKGGFKKSLDDIEDFGKELGARMIEGIAFGKGKLEDEVLIPNFSDIFGQDGIIGGIMKNSGMDLGSLFGKFFGQSASSAVSSSFSSQNGGGIFSNVQAGGSSTASVGQSGFDLGSIFGKMFGAGAQSGMFSNVQAGGSSTFASSAGGGGGFMSMFSGLFGGGTGGASGAGASSGSAYGSAFGYAALAALAVQAGKDFSKGKYGSGGGAIVGGVIGAYFGGPGGAAIGAQLGKMLGGLLDPLFKHEPTLGTQIRTKVKKFLKEIEVSFADEIDKDEYFFEETKSLADKMFGGDFLKASKQILNDKAGPEMAKQLQALGTIITAKWAKERDKDLEQTGTTFGNLLLDNLGLKDLPDAIDEIVEKANISFEGLTTRLTELFDEKKLISFEFYKTTIEGAVSLFFGELPDAINVSKLALQSFTDDGIFSLTTFQEKVKETTTKFSLVAQSFTDAIKNGKPGEEAAKLFGLQLLAGLEELAVDKAIQDFIDNKLFEGIDLSDGLDSTEIATLTERTKLASIEIDKLRTAMGTLGGDTSGVIEQIRALNAQLEELAQKRIQVRIDVIQQLQQIGSLSTSESIALQMKEFAAVVERALAVISDTRIGRSGDTALQHTSDADLQKMFDALGQMANLTVAQFQDFKQRREAALQEEIAAINSALQVRISAIQEALQADIAAIQKRLQADIAAIQAALEVQVTAIQEAADKRMDEIRKEYEAKREAVQKNIEQLREEQDQVRAIFELRREALEKELQTAQSFKQVAESLQQTINGLMSQDSPFSGPEELAFLQRQADDKRTQIANAKPEDRPELFNQLATLLQSQLTAGQGFLDPEAFKALFKTIVLELESLRDRAGEEGAKVEDIQKRIADNTTAMELALKLIDDKIAKQEKYLQKLSEDENNAIATVQKQAAADIKAAQEAAAVKIEAAQKAAADQIAAAQAQAALDIAAEQKAAALLIEAAQQKAAFDITEEQKRTENRLIELAKARDDILKEQAERITEQRDILREQLVTQFGAAEAERLLANPMIESAARLLDIHHTLVSIEEQLFANLNKTENKSPSTQTQAQAPAAFSGGRTSAAPSAGGTTNGTTSAAPVVIHLSQPVSVTWQSSGNSEEEARRVMRAMDQQAIDNVRHGPLGQEIMKKVREGMVH